MKKELKLPTAVIALQVILAALAGAAGKLYLQNYNWFLQFIAFILLFVLVYALIGLIYIKVKK
jgi:hypothetical protein